MATPGTGDTLFSKDLFAGGLVGESVGPGAGSHVHEGCWETQRASCFRAQQAGESGSRGDGLGGSARVQVGSRKRPGPGQWLGGKEGAGWLFLWEGRRREELTKGLSGE